MNKDIGSAVCRDVHVVWHHLVGGLPMFGGCHHSSQRRNSALTHTWGTDRNDDVSFSVAQSLLSVCTSSSSSRLGLLFIQTLYASTASWLGKQQMPAPKRRHLFKQYPASQPAKPTPTLGGGHNCYPGSWKSWMRKMQKMKNQGVFLNYF